MGSVEETPVPLPSAEPVVLSIGITLQPPLSRKGRGPGMIVVVPNKTDAENLDQYHEGNPSPRLKWAEESYAVVEIQSSALESVDIGDVLRAALDGLKSCSSCDDGNGVGLISYETELWAKIEATLQSFPSIIGAVAYGSALKEVAKSSSPVPVLYHLGGKSPSKLAKPYYDYDLVDSSYFALPAHKKFHYSSESVSHSRNLDFFKKLMNGPFFDLEVIWDEHTFYEFGDRSVANTMGTMVQEPYVNHIPTMTGGIGRERLTNFYRHHFIWNNPKDTELELVSRTIGIDRICDEFVFKCTHDMDIDWLIPGIPPTGKALRIPFTSIVNIRGDRLYHEHIAWDQASVLVQLGLMPEYLPYPYALPDGRKPAEGHKFEFKVPSAGVETAQKMLDRNSVPSNEMFEFKVREVPL